MNERPITEDDLHAFADEQLDGLRRAEVTAYLETHPAVAARVTAWRTQRQQLRDTLAPIAAEPLPPELNLRRMLGTYASEKSWWNKWRLPYWALSAAASLLLAVGGAGGWMVRGMGMGSSAGLMALGHEAIASYSVYAPDRLRPVELRAQDKPLLATWAQERTGHPIAIPELETSGYRFMGGRVVAGTHGAAVLLMYDDDKGTRLVMLAQPMPKRDDSTMTAVAAGDVHGFVWSDGGFGYSLVGEATPERLHPLANAIRQQIRERI
ncbi:hypothetical protein AXE65_01925 [Ventosimonas gracilis]|uniref:Anti-sigma factor n=1 Tax=Ventosimonas gracilis TaxID=1680762 RepID=A0A139SUT4_9GAMM|nr:anti-sigma factor [Ventosimonas gracilis]KXU38345.1 hypothetical protein AXE65_01925 [Ventosimonas gracilis]